jgi:hypothetical protein
MTVQNRLRRSQVGFLVQADWKLAVDWVDCLLLFLNKDKGSWISRSMNLKWRSSVDLRQSRGAELRDFFKCAQINLHLN